MVASLSIRRAEPEDASALIAAIVDCYGDTYVEYEALEVDRLRGLLAAERSIYYLAEVAGAVVGQIALEEVTPGLFLHCRAVVRDDYRGRGLMARMSAPLLGPEARRLGARLILGSSVTQHLATQRFNVRAGFQPLGLLLGIYPGIRPRGVPDSSQSVSGLLMGLPVEADPAPRRPRLPAWLMPRVERTYAALGIPLAPAAPSHSAGALGWSVDWHRDSGRCMWRFAPGLASPWPVQRELARATGEGARVFWADLPLEHPQAPALIEHLQALGFSYGALVPCAGAQGADVLRFQRCLEPLQAAPIKVLPQLASLRDRTLAEHTAARAGAPRVGGAA